MQVFKQNWQWLRVQAEKHTSVRVTHVLREQDKGRYECHLQATLHVLVHIWHCGMLLLDMGFDTVTQQNLITPHVPGALEQPFSSLMCTFGTFVLSSTTHDDLTMSISPLSMTWVEPLGHACQYLSVTLNSGSFTLCD